MLFSLDFKRLSEFEGQSRLRWEIDVGFSSESCAARSGASSYAGPNSRAFTTTCDSADERVRKLRLGSASSCAKPVTKQTN